MAHPTAVPALKILAASLALGLASSVAAQPSYLPVGPQTSVPVATVSGGGWSQCYLDTYDVAMEASTVLSACTGDRLMMACRETGTSTLTLLAQAPRADVIFETGSGSTTVHTANGTNWYFDNSNTSSNGQASWGFLRQGDAVTKSNCDVNLSGANNERLCWHLNPGSGGAGGYRCGSNEDLNDSTAWERLVFQAGAAPVAASPTPIPTTGLYGLIGTMVLLGLAASWKLRRRRNG